MRKGKKLPVRLGRLALVNISKLDNVRQQFTTSKTRTHSKKINILRQKTKKKKQS